MSDHRLQIVDDWTVVKVHGLDKIFDPGSVLLLPELRQWLKAHAIDSKSFKISFKLNPGIASVAFRDPQAAMLFKLMWS